MNTFRGRSAKTFRGLARTETLSDDPQWERVLTLQAGARLMTWTNWWEGRSSVVADANLMTRMSRQQRTLDGEPDLIDLLREKLADIQ